MTEPRTLIFLCRHAEPDNPAGVFYGHLPGFGLSSLGVRQALGLGDFLRDYPVQRFYSSPLLRALETARLAMSRLDREVPLEIRDELVEAHFGKYIEGIKRWQVPIRRPLFFFHAVRPGLLPGDEPVAQMAAPSPAFPFRGGRPKVTATWAAITSSGRVTWWRRRAVCSPQARAPR